MDISLPDSVKQDVDEQVHRGGYGSAGDYLHDLVRKDRDQNLKDDLEKSLLDSLNEGEAAEATPEWWAALREEVAHLRTSKSVKK